ncbi:LOW QUALITY PROTEIN: hypothetical protein PanWU01x14_287750 [Parasponia andersonii]|uniref:Uncharacterized protein n=1 Tax=Parasponia andersonii TaxID=3476 RepID=A0A2P5AYR0_PARAD|nr:LOW QUALITY PROTEIN: hypothetical protein PanWU01x14_287750 [Parasponia andersonii]
MHANRGSIYIYIYMVQTPNCDKSLVKPTCDRYIQQNAVPLRHCGITQPDTCHVISGWVHATEGGSSGQGWAVDTCQAKSPAFIDCNAFSQQLLPPSFNAIHIIHSHIQHTPSLSPIQLSNTLHDGASISTAAL